MRCNQCYLVSPCSRFSWLPVSFFSARYVIRVEYSALVVAQQQQQQQQQCDRFIPGSNLPSASALRLVRLVNEITASDRNVLRPVQRHRVILLARICSLRHSAPRLICNIQQRSQHFAPGFTRTCFPPLPFHPFPFHPLPFRPSSKSSWGPWSVASSPSGEWVKTTIKIGPHLRKLLALQKHVLGIFWFTL